MSISKILPRPYHDVNTPPSLPQSQTDASLEVDVTTIFRRFGHCWVKVKRDAQGMPMAFVQYRDANHATTAIREGAGIVICGRPCRVEKGKANRKFIPHCTVCFQS